MRYKKLRRANRPSDRISFEDAKDALTKLKSESIAVNVWHVFPQAECMVHGFIFGITKNSLLVRSDLKDDFAPFISIALPKKFRCSHYQMGPQWGAKFRRLGDNVLAFFFADHLYVHVYY